MSEPVSINFTKCEMDPPTDRTSNTFMFAEVRIADGEHVLTRVQHTAIDTSLPAEPVTFTFTVSVDCLNPDDGFVLI